MVGRKILGVDRVHARELRHVREEHGGLHDLVQAAAGVVRRLNYTGTTGGEHAHYELAEDLTQHHHHLVCRGCGTIQDVTLDHRLERSLGEAFDRMASRAGFRFDRHDIDVFGTCALCASG